MNIKMRSNIIKLPIINKHLLKLISFVFAVILWFFVLSSRPIEVDYVLPISFESPIGKGISSLLDKNIKLKLKGSRIYIKNYINEQNLINLKLDKKNKVSKNKYKFSLATDSFHLPFGVSVVDFSPKEILVEVDKIIYKKVPVKLNLRNDLNEKYRILGSSVSPSEVMIQGPRNTMRKISHILTDPIPLSDISSDKLMKVKLETLDSRISFKENNTSLVDVELLIRPKQSNLEIKNNMIYFLSSTQKFIPSVKMAKLSVLVNDANSFHLDRKKIRVVAIIPETNRKKIKVELKAELPDEIHLLKIKPKFIEVRLLK